ncbi:hypothetical protein BKP45_14480 [Anaerobacillus alkalidiazotrophicus]|uniref:PLD phosphodiesterase domain-containing protein n=1 Tax=Anaerobacillus alkalidiazotrophicus TaxID=472963 RepID=A0A1S2M2Y5_9BACI|nr:hypothetical protein BKP45_14480 [Anaerobacillus alkalidiazotrophicus]
MRNRPKTLSKVVTGLFVTCVLYVIYVIYAFSFGVLIFHFHQYSESNYLEQNRVERFWGEEISQDRVVLVDDRYEAGIARIHMIENAQHTLDISYYTIHPGQSSDIFFSYIISAADRGVQVRLLLDGIFHNLKGNRKGILYSLAYHPGIELKFYEPFDMFRPWTWNNRLHDKLIIADKELAMIGGRNIGDKYFAPDGYEGASNDRDVIIINTGTENVEDSGIYDMKNYFEYVWNHDFSKFPLSQLTKAQEEKSQKTLSNFRRYIGSGGGLDYQDIDWIERSLPTNKITFIHNPIDRLNKEPWVWYDITRLMENSEKSIYIQSPYILPTNNMVKHIDVNEITAEDIVILTNSLAATPNKLAYSGYLRYRESIANSGVNLFEYQGPTESLHTKTYVFDSRISMIGSFNLDPRSTYLSTESMVVIDSKQFADSIESKIEDHLLYDSLKVKHDGEYIDNPLVVEEDVSFFKATITKSLSIFMRFFEFLL